MKNIIAREKANIAVVLHDVRSVHNVGSIFRTADAAGVSKIFLCGITPTPLDRFKNVRPDFGKVSLGAEQNIAWEHCLSADLAIKKLKDDGCKIFAIEQSKQSMPYYSVREKNQLSEKIALVLGNEVSGLPPEILAASDVILEIPMSGKKESLNVAVAF